MKVDSPRASRSLAPDAREDAVHHADPRRLGRHEASPSAPAARSARPGADRCSCPTCSGPVSTRIWRARRVELGVVGHEGLAAARAQQRLDHRVAARRGSRARALASTCGPGPAVAPRDLGQRRERVELRHRVAPRRRSRRACSSAARRTRSKHLALERRGALGRAEHARSISRSSRRGEALGVGQGLLALVVRRARARAATSSPRSP